MKGYRRQNVAKLPTVDTLIEIPTKTIYGIQLVTFFYPTNDKTKD